MKVAIILGTRPEAIKLAPIIAEARRRSEIQPLVVSTGQHAQMLDQVLEFFGIVPDIDLQLMTAGQSLANLTSLLMQRLDQVLAEHEPDVVMVQGDTTTAFCGALAAFYRRIPVAHVEAGLRTDRLDAPFPEEFNRRGIGQIASWHFAPTPTSAALLERDALPLLGGKILVTGNTVIDALQEAAARVKKQRPVDELFIRLDDWRHAHPQGKVVLVTGHRRENFGAPFREFCQALKDVSELELPDASGGVLVIYPVHLNPNVQEPVKAILGQSDRVWLTAPKSYPIFVRLMVEADLIITDSGGVQEEAPALGKPVLVTRDTTERPEALTSGLVSLVGTQAEKIVAGAKNWLSRNERPAAVSPYGDGFAAGRCLDALLGLNPQPWSQPSCLDR